MKPAAIAGILSLMLLAACSHSNNLLLGEVRASVAGHDVTVTDCYRTQVDAPHRIADSETGEATYQFMPCRDANVIVRGNQLSVNDRDYGLLRPGDAVLVDHGAVSVQRSGARARP